jgi:hypothetical protein
MDNKQNRQFYWEVKDFMNKKPETYVPKKDTLKESIASVMNKNNIYRQNDFEKETTMSSGLVNQYLTEMVRVEKKETAKDPHLTNNKTSNAFFLKEWGEGWFGFKPRESVPYGQDSQPQSTQPQSTQPQSTQPQSTQPQSTQPQTSANNSTSGAATYSGSSLPGGQNDGRMYTKQEVDAAWKAHDLEQVGQGNLGPRTFSANYGTTPKPMAVPTPPIPNRVTPSAPPPRGPSPSQGQQLRQTSPSSMPVFLPGQKGVDLSAFNTGPKINLPQMAPPKTPQSVMAKTKTLLSGFTKPSTEIMA